MMPTTVRSPPSLDDYTPLSEHQEQTPASFYGGKPVLHYHAAGAKAWIPKSQRGRLPFFPADLSTEPTAPEGGALNGSAEENVEQKVDIFVNSQYDASSSNPHLITCKLTRHRTLTIFCPAAESGLSIPYPLISVHAIKTLSSADQTYPSVYLQLELADGGGGDDDDFETVELTLIPPTSTSTSATSPSETTKLFEAISDCSNLNPDPVEDGDEDEDDEDRIIFEGDHEAVEGFSGVFTGASDGRLPPPMPGSSGWITAENMHEYFDEDGNWIGDEGVSGELGDGAGAIHKLDDDEEDSNGNEADEEGETKRLRKD
jgi:chloride channel, nucleotide-sensitive, 1A